MAQWCQSRVFSEFWCGKHWHRTMTAVAGSGGQPNASKQVYEFALRASCSDGKIWPEEQYKAAERLDPENSDADKRKYQEFLLKLGGLIRDQFLVHDPKARGVSLIHALPAAGRYFTLY